MKYQLFLIVKNSVSIGSFQHLLPILLTIVFAVFFIKYSQRNLNENQQQRVIHYFGSFISIIVLAYHLFQILFDNYDFKRDLPLSLCSLMALLIPIFTYYRKYWMFEIVLFWIIGGTSQAVITPDITEGFPSFDYFRYWVVHLGLLVVIFYFIFVFQMKPKFKSVLKSFLALQLYVLFMVLLNYILDANYFYLNNKPKSASLLDYFGEWPYYIFICQLIIIPLFLIIYLPFYVSKKRNYLANN